MVPHDGIEYMAGGTGAHRTIGKRALVGNSKKQQQHQNQKLWGREKPKPYPGAEVCLTEAISSYTAKAG
jgi:hypothetical protein